MTTFKALLVTEENDGYAKKIVERTIDELPENEVLIKVFFSSLNYKDALSAAGNRGVTKKYPHTPGIDAAGVIERDITGKFKPGEKVIVIGYDLGMNTPGGFGQYIKVPANWVLNLPEKLSLKTAMIFGTAGFTAAMSISRLETFGLKKDAGEVLVTGATGGVGSMAVAMLNSSGYKVVASTGKKDKIDFLKSLGAEEVISRDEIDDKSSKPLLKPRWAGVVDTVGGNILATALKSAKYNSSVTTCGLTSSPELNTTVFPFILRGVNLLGIDSVEQPVELKEKIWNEISNRWSNLCFKKIYEELSLEQVSTHLEKMIKGGSLGRKIVNLD